MSLGDWKKNGWLVEHKTSPKEIADILAASKSSGSPAAKHRSLEFGLFCLTGSL